MKKNSTTTRVGLLIIVLVLVLEYIFSVLIHTRTHENVLLNTINSHLLTFLLFFFVFFLPILCSLLSVIDPNACAENSLLCTYGTCVNTPDGYKCNCRRGFRAINNGQACEGTVPTEHCGNHSSWSYKYVCPSRTKILYVHIIRL